MTRLASCAVRIKNVLSGLKVIRLMGYEAAIKISRSSFNGPKRRRLGKANQSNLNVGSGGNRLRGFTNLDLASTRYSSIQTRYIQFDLRKDVIPLADGTVQNIYASHVIEHVEVKEVQLFLADCFRVLGSGGVMRIATPDRRFLFDMAKDHPDFFLYRYPSLGESGKLRDGVNPVQLLLHDVNTGLVETSDDNWAFSENRALSRSSFEKMEYPEFAEFVGNHQVEFDYGNPSKHISSYDSNELREMAEKAGFRFVLSKPNGSISPLMRSVEFDRTWPGISLLVDLEKQ